MNENSKVLGGLVQSYDTALSTERQSRLALLGWLCDTGATVIVRCPRQPYCGSIVQNQYRHYVFRRHDGTEYYLRNVLMCTVEDNKVVFDCAVDLAAHYVV